MFGIEEKFTDDFYRINANLDRVDIEGDIVASCEFADIKLILSRNYENAFSHSIIFGESVSNYQWKQIVDFSTHPGATEDFKNFYSAMLYFNQGEHNRLFEFFNYERKTNPVIDNIFNKFEDEKQKEKQKIINTVSFFSQERTREYILSTVLLKNASVEKNKMIEKKIGFFANLPDEVLANIAKLTANSKFVSSEEAEKIVVNAQRNS